MASARAPACILARPPVPAPMPRARTSSWRPRSHIHVTHTIYHSACAHGASAVNESVNADASATSPAGMPTYVLHQHAAQQAMDVEDHCAAKCPTSTVA